MSFDKSMERLKEIVATLGKGNLELDEAMKLFEEGTELVRSCNAALDQAEQKVTILTGEGEKPFDE